MSGVARVVPIVILSSQSLGAAMGFEKISGTFVTGLFQVELSILTGESFCDFHSLPFQYRLQIQ